MALPTIRVCRIVKISGDATPCELCGRACRAKVAVMSTGQRFGVDCGELVDRAASRAFNGFEPWSERQARFSGAGDKQVEYLRAHGFVA